MGNVINRDLVINGNGRSITIEGDSTFAVNDGGTTLQGPMFNLGNDGSSGVFHLKNIAINRSTSGSGQNAFISIWPAGGDWEVIFDDFIADFQLTDGDQWLLLQEV